MVTLLAMSLYNLGLCFSTFSYKSLDKELKAHLLPQAIISGLAT